MSKKGLIVYDSIYGSTTEVAHWIKALIGYDRPIDVKHLDQVVTVKPYDYIILGSHTRMEKVSKNLYKFVEKHHGDIQKKEMAYFVCSGDYDETMVLQAPGQPSHPIGGRNFLIDIIEKYPKIKPLALGGFGGRHVFPTLTFKEDLMIKLVSALAKEGSMPIKTQDIWDTLKPERVEVFANEIREKILGLPKLKDKDAQKFRSCWDTPQPAREGDPTKIRYEPIKIFKNISNARTYVRRFRIKADLKKAEELINQWADECGINLSVHQETFFNKYFQGVKKYKKKQILHLVIATFPEDPGHVHAQLYCWSKPAQRKNAELDIDRAEEIICADGRKAEV